jgi:hypothetical protein
MSCKAEDDRTRGKSPRKGKRTEEGKAMITPHPFLFSPRLFSPSRPVYLFLSRAVLFSFDVRAPQRLSPQAESPLTPAPPCCPQRNRPTPRTLVAPLSKTGLVCPSSPTHFLLSLSFSSSFVLLLLSPLFSFHPPTPPS